MTNNLLHDWNLRTKFVDNTSALEIIPRNSTSVLNNAVADIHNFAMEHNMKLNPTKCKEMFIKFLRTLDFLIRPLQMGNHVIKQVKTYKILGVIMSYDLKWECHVDYIFKKAGKKLNSVRVLRRAGVESTSTCGIVATTLDIQAGRPGFKPWSDLYSWS